jgi:hypothetical protein
VTLRVDGDGTAHIMHKYGHFPLFYLQYHPTFHRAVCVSLRESAPAGLRAHVSVDPRRSLHRPGCGRGAPVDSPLTAISTFSLLFSCFTRRRAEQTAWTSFFRVSNIRMQELAGRASVAEHRSLRGNGTCHRRHLAHRARNTAPHD